MPKAKNIFIPRGRPGSLAQSSTDGIFWHLATMGLRTIKQQRVQQDVDNFVAWAQLPPICLVFFQRMDLPDCRG